MSLFALAFPWLLIFLLLTAFVSLIKRKWLISIIAIVILLVLNWYGKCLPIKLNVVCPNTSEQTLKIVTFNIDGASGDVMEKARNVRAFLNRLPADLVFVAEFNEQYPKELDSLLRIEYAYTTYPDYLFFQYFYGHYPLFNSRRLKDKEGDPVGVYACSTVFKGDTIDLYGCHLASNNYNQNLERVSPEVISNPFGALKYISNIESAGRRRREEVETIVREISKSSHKVIVLGDMNDVCGSPTLRALNKAGLKDAWWEKGIGYGATINTPFPYRIDHFLFGEGISAVIIEVIDSRGISDHHALYAEFTLE